MVHCDFSAGLPEPVPPSDGTGQELVEITLDGEPVQVPRWFAGWMEENLVPHARDVGPSASTSAAAGSS